MVKIPLQIPTHNRRFSHGFFRLLFWTYSNHPDPSLRLPTGSSPGPLEIYPFYGNFLGEKPRVKYHTPLVSSNMAGWKKQNKLWMDFFSWENHMSKWSIFQQAMFDYRKVNHKPLDVAKNSLPGVAPTRGWRPGCWWIKTYWNMLRNHRLSRWSMSNDDKITQNIDTIILSDVWLTDVKITRLMGKYAKCQTDQPVWSVLFVWCLLSIPSWHHIQYVSWDVDVSHNKGKPQRFVWFLIMIPVEVACLHVLHFDKHSNITYCNCNSISHQIQEITLTWLLINFDIIPSTIPSWKPSQNIKGCSSPPSPSRPCTYMFFVDEEKCQNLNSVVAAASGRWLQHKQQVVQTHFVSLATQVPWRCDLYSKRVYMQI